MSVELEQQLQELQAENEKLRKQVEQKSKVATRALASYQQRALHMELIRQQNEDMDNLLAEVRRLAAIVENHPDFIGVGSLTGEAEYVNPAGIRMIGLTPDYDVTQMKASNFYPAADAELLMQEGIPTALEKGSWSSEGNLLKADGTTIPVEQTIGINYNADGTPNSFSITMRAITDRKKTEAELEDRLLELSAMQQKMRREGWESLLQTQALATGYQYDQIAVTPTDDLGLPELEQIVEQATRVTSSAGRQPAAVAPLSIANQVVGVLGVQDNPENPLSEDDLALIELVSQQMAQSLQNAELFQQTQQSGELLRKRVEELNAMTDLGREIADSPPIADLFEWVTNRIPLAIQYPEICKVAINYKDRIYGDPEAVDLPAQIVHALRIGNEVVGRVYIAYTQKHDFLDEESALLGGTANRLSSYIESRNLFEQTQQRAIELEESTNYLNSVIDNIPSGLFVKDAKDLRFLQWNKANETIHGLMKEDLLGKSDYDFFSPEEADHFVNTDRKVLGGREMVDIPEEIVNTPHRGVRVLRTRKIPVFGTDGQPRFLLGISEDITERKEAEAEREKLLAEMEQSQELLRTVIDATPDWIFIKDRDHRFSLVNQGFADSQNIPVDELIGKNDLDLGVPEELVKGNPEKGIKGFWPDDDEVLESGESKIVAVEPTVIDGKQAYLSTIKVPLTDAGGNRWGVLAFVRDVTEREQLLTEVQQLAAIVENHPDFIGIGSLDGYPRYINPAGLKMIGLPPDHDVTTMHSTDIYPPADLELLGEGIPIALKQGFWLAEANLLRTDGSTTPVERTISVIRDASGEPASFSITMRDITERKQANEEREQLLEEVQAAYRQFVVREWGQFLSDQHRGNLHIEHGQDIEQDSNGSNGQAQIETPIALRGQVIGSLSLQDINPNRKWTDEEKALVDAVSEQLAQTVENLRLFENTQQRAGREQLTREITDKMRTAPNVESIINTGLQELSKALGVSRTYVKLSPDLEENE